MDQIEPDGDPSNETGEIYTQISNNGDQNVDSSKETGKIDTQISNNGDQNGDPSKETGEIDTQISNNGDQNGDPSKETGEIDTQISNNGDQNGDPSKETGEIDTQISNNSDQNGVVTTDGSTGAQADQKETKTTKKTKLYWLDKMKDDISENFRAAFMADYKKEFEHYDIESIHSFQSCSDKSGKFIVICRKVTCRLEQILDYFLEDFEESLFGRVLVIFVHNKEIDEIPHVSSKAIVANLKPYKELKYIMDVSNKCQQHKFLRLFKSPLKILFHEDSLQDFLKTEN